MSTTCELLDALKARQGWPSDYKAAKELGLSKQQVSRYRNKQDFFGPEQCLKVAKLLNLDAGAVLAAVQAERAKKPALRAAWKELAKRAGGVAAAVIVASALSGPVSPARADAGQMYIMSNDRRRRRRRATDRKTPRFRPPVAKLKKSA